MLLNKSWLLIKKYTDVVKEFKLHQTYFVNKNELQQLEDAIMNEDKTAVKPDIVGKSVDIGNCQELVFQKNNY